MMPLLHAQAVIFAPSGTPYANGAFAFDILLPPGYPNQPPQVWLWNRR